MRRVLFTLCFVMPACIVPIELPDVGLCADYPEGLFDYGDMGIGTCLAGPVDMLALEGEGGADWQLFVANSNPNLLFTSGSILALDGQKLEAAALAGIAGEQDVFLIHDLASSAGITRSFSGPILWDDTLNTFFYGNRLSYTASTSTSDRVEGMVYEGGSFSPFESFLPYDYTYGDEDDLDEVVTDSSYIEVGADPYALIQSPDSDVIFVVDTGSREITTLSLNDDGNVAYNRTLLGAKLPNPEASDLGITSNLECVILGVDEESLPTDIYTATYLESLARVVYPVEWNGVTALALAETPDGIRWQPDGDTPFFTPYDEDGDNIGDGFDAQGIVSSFVASENDAYLLWFEGVNADGISSIGFALGGSRATEFTREGNSELVVDGVEDPESEGLVLVPGPDAFDAGGCASPSILRPGGSIFRMWYTAYDSAGQARIARATGNNAVEFEKEGVVFEAADVPGATADTDLADPVVFLRQVWRDQDGFVMYYVEGDLDAGTCLKYAESPDGDTLWTPGGENNVAPGCLLSEADGLPPLLRSPSFARLGSDAFRLFISGAYSPEGPWSVYSARSFDGMSWEVEGEVSILDVPPGLPPSLPVPSAVTTAPISNTGASFRVESASFGYEGRFALGSPFVNQGLAMTFFEGHVLPAPPASQPWWGAPSGYTPGLQVDMGEPAVLPDMAALFVTSELEETDTRLLGVAYADPADKLVANSRFGVPDSVEGLLLDPSSEDSTTAGIHNPWLLRPDADNADTVWLYYELDLDGASTLHRRISSDGGSTFSEPSSVAISGTDSDESPAAAPTIIVGHDGRYHLWYSASLGSANPSLHHAISDDGLSFAKSTNGGIPLGQAGTWDDSGLTGPTAIWDEASNVYRLWYAGDSGSEVHIGYAEGLVDGDEITYSRYIGSDGRRESSFSVGGEIWDAAGVFNPMVVQTAPDSFHLYFEGRYTDVTSRIGYATSKDGLYWSRTYAPGTSGDVTTLSTAPAKGVDSGDPKDDGTFTLFVGLTSADGANPLSMEVFNIETSQGMTPCFAVLTLRTLNQVYVMDIFDDSSSRFGGVPGPCVEATNPSLFASAGADWVDSNLNSVEEVFLLQNDLGSPGTRSIGQSPDGKTLYLTSASFDSLLIVDATYFVDDERLQRGERSLPVLGNVEMARGASSAADDPDADDLISDITTDIGPSAVVVSPFEDGRYVFVANANEGSVYTVDTTRGAYGQVVASAEGLGLIPSALALSPDGNWLFVSNYVGDIDGVVVNSTMSIIDARPTAETFGQSIAKIKNREL